MQATDAEDEENYHMDGRLFETNVKDISARTVACLNLCVCVCVFFVVRMFQSLDLYAQKKDSRRCYNDPEKDITEQRKTRKEKKQKAHCESIRKPRTQLSHSAGRPFASSS